MHFLTSDRRAGGHVLDFQAVRGAIAAATRHDSLQILLPPPGGAFDGVDLSPDRSAELESVEKNPRR
jgi:alpha-acetolactate decarboxylase